MVPDDSNDSGAAAELRAFAARYHARVAAAAAAGKAVPLARSCFWDDLALDVVGDEPATPEPPLLPGAHNKG